MARKGISPLIASVLLLAVTLSIAGIFSGWGPGLISDVTEQTRDQAETSIDCNKAGVKIRAAEYFSGENTSVVLRNTGRTELVNLTVAAFQSNDLPINDTTTDLKRGNFTAVNVTTTSKPAYVEVFSECESAKDKYEQIS